jgi:HD-GYP domain-containing protein (c-di-GMP phosphodiesterase class II)
MNNSYRLFITGGRQLIVNQPITPIYLPGELEKLTERQISKFGTTFILQLYGALKTIHLHEFHNPAVGKAIEKLYTTLTYLQSKLGDLVLQLVDEYLFLNKIRIQINAESFMGYDFIVGRMKSYQIGGIIFLREIDLEELKQFGYLFLQIDSQSKAPLEQLATSLRNHSITGIRLLRPEEISKKLKSTPVDTREKAKLAYFRTIFVAKQTARDVLEKETLNVKRVKRAIQPIVDLVLQDEFALLGLTMIQNYDAYTSNHSVNVSVYSIILGQKLGLSKKQLEDLGITALFHDIGKTEILSKILNKPSKLTDEEWRVVQEHPITAAIALVKLKEVNELIVKSMIVGFEHHLNYDLSGYPKLTQPKKQHPFSRIVSIADCFDAMTSSRVYNKPLSPDNALALMLKKSGKIHDPVLLKLFINTVGVYPVGTLVQLNTGELGIVLRTNPREILRPQIKLILDSKGRKLDGEVINLAAQGETFKRDIVKVLSPTEYGINVSDLI